MFSDVMRKQNSQKNLCRWIIIGSIITLGVDVFLLGPTYEKRTIVSDASCQIISVEVYDIRVDEQIPVPNEMYDDEVILKILNNFYEKRTPVKDNGFRCSDVELRIVLWDSKRGMRDIRLGSQSYSCAERGSNRYKILQPTELLVKLYNEIPEEYCA